MGETVANILTLFSSQPSKIPTLSGGVHRFYKRFSFIAQVKCDGSRARGRWIQIPRMVNKFRFFCQIRPVAAFARNQGCHECFLSWKLSPLKNNPLKYMLAAATAAATPPPRTSQMFPPWKISHLVKFMLSAASATTSVLYAFSRAKTLPENLLLLYMCCWSFSLPTWSL